MTAQPSYRLPRSVLPRRYELEFHPDLVTGLFSGTMSVELEVVEAVEQIVLNAVGLQLEQVRLTDPDHHGLVGTVTYQPALERAVLTWPQAIMPGVWTLGLRFSGALAEDLRGFYRTTVDLGDGTEAVIASTQCESTDARRVFPGWDEPDFKAVFAITLVVDDHLVALSNGPEVSATVAGPGKRRVGFAETMPMSTYLVALVVGPLALTTPKMVGQVPVRIAARPALSHLTGVAEEAAVATLGFFQEYFGLPCPAEKMDHVAIPDFAAGAMENLGCVTYREDALLVDRMHSSPMEQMRVVTVIAHETAHMWFGDLVSMRWWNGLWLNEAFATFMELLATDALHPEWDVWTTFGPGRAYALAVDGLASTRPVEFPVGPPSEAAAMFDVLTYAKGGAILRAMEQYLGPEVFRQGVGIYLKRHRYQNTDTEDLWTALEEAAGQPVRAVMDSWVSRPGYPIVQVTWDSARHQLSLAQSAFRYGQDGEGEWQVPVVIEMGHAHGASEIVRVLLQTEPVSLAAPGDMTWIKVNQGGWGFYRVAYAPELWRRLLPEFPAMTPLERLGLVEDVWAAVLAGRADLEQAVQLWRGFGDERDPDVWSALVSKLTLLDHMASDSARTALQALIATIAVPVLQAVGWDSSPGESVRQGRLRALLVRLLGTIGGDFDVAQEAKRRLMAHFDGIALVSPDLLSAVVEVVAYSGTMHEWEMIYRQFQSARTPQDETRYLYALGDFADAEALERSLSVYQSDEVKIQHGVLALSRMLMNRHAERAAWAVVEARWQTMLDKYPASMFQYLVQPVGWMTAPGLGEQAIAWLDAHPVQEAARAIAQAKEFQQIHRSLAQRIRADLAHQLSR